jgi:transglutaminase-like putative cysteine protease
MESLDLGFRGRPNNTLVMKVRAPGPDFWRAQSFDTYDGRRWSNSDTQVERIVGGRGLVPHTPREETPMLSGDDFIQTFFIEQSAPNMVFAAATPSRVYWPFDDAYQLSDGTLRGGDTLSPGTVYSVISKRLPVTPDWLRSRDARVDYVDPAVRLRYTALPVIPARVRDLAAQLAARAPTSYDVVGAMTDWIATHTKYSLNPPRLGDGEDAVEQFLFEDQRGFCEQIAASLVVMLRSVGIPARLTVGYSPGKRNPFSGLYEVRASDAHAYTEVLFPGVGWQSFDPTAEVPLAGEFGAFPRFAGAGLASWVTEHMPSTAVLYGGGAVAVVLAVAGYGIVVMRRARRRTWLDAQLAQLARRTGVAIAPTMTLPDWLAALPAERQHELAPIVAALESEAWSPTPLDDADRALVERRLAGVR